SALAKTQELQYLSHTMWSHDAGDLFIQISMIATKEQRSARIAKLAQQHRTQALLQEWCNALDRPPSIALSDPATVTYPEFLTEFVVTEIQQLYDPTDQQLLAGAMIVNDCLTEFAETNRTELVEILREYISILSRDGVAESEEVQRWARRAITLFQALRATVMDAQSKWETLLTPRQKEVHRAAIERLFTFLDRGESNLARWSKGLYEQHEIREPFDTGIRR